MDKPTILTIARMPRINLSRLKSKLNELMAEQFLTPDWYLRAIKFGLSLLNLLDMLLNAELWVINRFKLLQKKHEALKKQGLSLIETQRQYISQIKPILEKHRQELERRISDNIDAAFAYMEQISLSWKTEILPIIDRGLRDANQLLIIDNQMKKLTKLHDEALKVENMIKSVRATGRISTKQLLYIADTIGHNNPKYLKDVFSGLLIVHNNTPLEFNINGQTSRYHITNYIFDGTKKVGQIFVESLNRWIPLSKRVLTQTLDDVLKQNRAALSGVDPEIIVAIANRNRLSLQNVRGIVMKPGIRIKNAVIQNSQIFLNFSNMPEIFFVKCDLQALTAVQKIMFRDDQPSIFLNKILALVKAQPLNINSIVGLLSIELSDGIYKSIKKGAWTPGIVFNNSDIAALKLFSILNRNKQMILIN